MTGTVVSPMNGSPFTSPPVLLMEVVAGALVILAQVQADRWVRGAKRHRFLLAATFVMARMAAFIPGASPPEVKVARGAASLTGRS